MVETQYFASPLYNAKIQEKHRIFVVQQKTQHFAPPSFKCLSTTINIEYLQPD